MPLVANPSTDLAVKPPTGRIRALLVNDTALSGHHGSHLVVRQLEVLAGAHGIDLAVGWDWPSIEALDLSGSGFDLAIINGEGSVHNDSATARRVAAFASRADAAGLPAHLVNATLEGLSAGLIADLAKLRHIFVRDQASRAYLESHGLAASVVHDLTLSWADAPRAGGGATVFVSDASDETKTRRLMAVADRLGAAEMITLRARPTQSVNGRASRRRAFEVKRFFLRFSSASPKRLRYAGAIPAFDDFVDFLLKRGAGLVSGRYHGACLAVRLGLPFVAIDGNTGKTRNLLTDMGMADRLVSLQDLVEDPSRAVPHPFSPEEETKRADFLAAVEAKAAAMMAQIRQDVLS